MPRPDEFDERDDYDFDMDEPENEDCDRDRIEGERFQDRLDVYRNEY